MTTIYFTDSTKDEWPAIRIKVSGWVVCYDKNGTVKVAYPPQKVVRIEDDGEEQDENVDCWGLKTESPNGRI